jgi:hypothetical protein
MYMFRSPQVAMTFVHNRCRGLLQYYNNGIKTNRNAFNYTHRGKVVYIQEYRQRHTLDYYNNGIQTNTDCVLLVLHSQRRGYVKKISSQMLQNTPDGY